ncbi:MAG: hypothetical protein HZB23_08600 [Deltaproteobacteria bacterium]|nr:hypothetical protein [Deltaproteobacteria bacterium]
MMPFFKAKRTVAATAFILVAFFLCAMLTSCSFMGYRAKPQEVAPERPIAKLVHHTGTVILKVRGKWGVLPTPNLPLYSGDKIVTLDGTALIGYPDGARVSLCTDSNLTITQQLQEWTPFRTKRFIDRNFVLLAGRLFFQTGREKIQHHFITPQTIIGVFFGRGNVSVDSKQKTWIIMDKGRAIFKIGEYKKGFAPLVSQAKADKAPLLQAVLAAEIASSQAELAAEENEAGNMSAAQKSWYMAQRDEKSALEVIKAASILEKYHPEAFTLKWARREMKMARLMVKDAGYKKKQAIEAGAVVPGTEMPDTSKDAVRVAPAASYGNSPENLAPLPDAPVATPGEEAPAPAPAVEAPAVAPEAESPAAEPEAAAPVEETPAAEPEAAPIPVTPAADSAPALPKRYRILLPISDGGVRSLVGGTAQSRIFCNSSAASTTS